MGPSIKFVFRREGSTGLGRIVRVDLQAEAQDGTVAKKYREVRQILNAAGWRRVRIQGSHEIWRSADASRSATIPSGGKDSREVPAGTLASIRRATGLKELR